MRAVIDRPYSLDINLIDRSTINYAAGFTDCLKADLIVIHFDDHEVIVFIEARRPDRAVQFHSTTTRLATRPCDEVLDALLRFDPLVDVIMS